MLTPLSEIRRLNGGEEIDSQDVYQQKPSEGDDRRRYLTVYDRMEKADLLLMIEQATK